LGEFKEKSSPAWKRKFFCDQIVLTVERLYKATGEYPTVKRLARWLGVTPNTVRYWIKRCDKLTVKKEEKTYKFMVTRVIPVKQPKNSK